VDILVYNAGIFPFGPTEQASPGEVDAVYDLNVKAPFYLVAELAPAMAERGHGAIVNVSTMVAECGVAGMALYGSSKAALNLLTKAWAAEFDPHGVRVNAVEPGRPARRAPPAWATASPPSPPRHPQGGRPHRRRSPTWRATRRASSTERSCPSTAAVRPSDAHRPSYGGAGLYCPAPP
jgi:NAD(P)-dependent dehydrogenase (short-subunit alcohol dehydrogenase family)